MRLSSVTGALLLLTGCATLGSLAPQSVVWRRFEAPYAQVWAASLQALAPATIRTQDQARGLIVTNWYEGYAQRTQGFLFGGGAYHRRVRYRLTLIGEGAATRVGLLASVEERAPGGPRAYRWERVALTDEQYEELFDAISRQLQAREADQQGDDKGVG